MKIPPMNRISLLLLFLALSGFNLYSQAPYAWYPLNGNAIDSSGNNLNGTIYGNPVPGPNRFNQPNQALVFNGTTDYIVLPAIFDFPTRTVMVWINPTYIGNADINFNNSVYDADNTNVQNGLTSLGCYMVTANNGYNNFNIQTVTAQSDQYGYNATANLNEWYHLAVVRTPLLAKYYLNGVMIDSGSIPNGLHSTNQATYNAVVGASRDFNQNFYGTIDDLKIYNVALTDSAIFAEFNAGSYYLVNNAPVNAADTIYIHSADTIHYVFTDTTHYIIIDTAHVSVTDTAHITVTDTTTVAIGVTDTLYIDANLTGVTGPNSVNILKVYPNPARDQLFINTGNQASMDGYIIKISNSLGQDVFSSLVNQQLFDIDLSGWTGRGTYVLYLIDPSLNVIATKLIVLQ